MPVKGIKNLYGEMNSLQNLTQLNHLAFVIPDTSGMLAEPYICKAANRARNNRHQSEA